MILHPKQEIDLQVQILQNMLETASESFQNLKNEKITLDNLRVEIIDIVTSLTELINTEFDIFELTSNLLKDILEKKKQVIKDNSNSKTPPTNISEEAKIFRYCTQDYLKILNKIENSKAYLNDIRSMVIVQAPVMSNLASQEILQSSNNHFNLRQLDKLSQENFLKLPNQCSKENNPDNKAEVPESKENLEEKGHRFTQIVCVPDDLPKDIHEAFINANLPQKIVKNVKLSKKIRKDYIEANYNDLLYNPKYEQIWENIPEEVYRFFTGEIRKFAIKNNYQKYIKRSNVIMTFIRKFLRVKYTLIKGVDYVSPDGGFFVDKIKAGYTKKWIKIKMVLNIDNVTKHHKSIGYIRKMFNYYFYKRYNSNTFKLYGEIKHYHRLNDYTLWNEAFKDKYDYICFKCYQHEEDLMKRFNYHSNFRHNLDSSFVEEMNERIKEFEEIRKEYARLVLNYLVI